MNSIRRRYFFQNAAAALSATRVVGANQRIRVGIIGLGGRGTYHVRYYGEIPECEITALCDVNQSARERAQARLQTGGGGNAKEYVDMRDLFADRAVNAVSIAIPNHWHALATIWACQAGKDVYVEKPASHNVHEGWRMLEVARKTGRMVQVGTQGRSMPHTVRAMELLKSGAIGKVYMAKGLCFKRRKSIGKTPPEPVPPGLDWDKFLGPAPMRPYTKNRFAYNWHWFWDTGNGDIGNQGAHQMDSCRWGLAEVGMPRSIVSSGGKFLYDDDQETPNTQLASFDYGDRQIVFEVRGLITGPEAGQPMRRSSLIGNLFVGGEGWMWLDGSGFQVFKGESGEKVAEQQVDDSNGEVSHEGTRRHIRNFFAACRSRNHRALTADIENAAVSAALCHLANISYRVGRKLSWDHAAKKFVNDAAADRLLTREYRSPYVM